ncbi:MAG TPA: hypothetical protein VGY97_02590 [Solirubrobacteraceae bacterium]|nr:hypothetical protein [Solirubrobacteraceae bacterium]
MTRAQPLGPPITGRRRVRLNRRGRATLTLTLTPAGRQPVRAALASCRSLALTVDLLVRRRHVRRRDQLTAGSSCPRSGGAGVQGLNTPGGGFPAGLAGLGKGPPAIFRVGAGVADFSPPAFGKAPGDPTASCDPTGMFSGKRDFAFMEPYVDAQGSGHYDGPSQGPPPLPGDPYTDCNQNGRWDGNLLGGGSNTPRFYTMVADPVTARAMVVSNGQQTIAVEVVDQEGLFNVYQQQIRDKVAADGYPLTGIFISATHDESAPDTLGLGGVTPATSGVNDYFVNYFVAKSAAAIEQAYQALRPATIRYTEVLEPANMRQCWSSYPFVDDQHMPVLQAVGTDGRPIATLASVSQHAETLGFNGGGAKDGAFTLDQEKTWVTSDWPYFFRSALEQHYGGVAIEMAGSVGSVESPQVYPSSIPRSPQKFIDAGHPAGCRTLFQAGGQDDTGGAQHVPLGYNGETRAFGQQMAGPIIQALDSGSYYPSTSSDIWGARTNVCIPLENQGFAAFAQAGVFAHRPGFSSDCSQQFPVAPNGSTSGQSVQTQVAAFRIGDGQFISIPGEVFPFTYLRGFLGPNDMPNKQPGLPPWLIPHMHTPFRFIDGLAEDMIGYIFPQGNDVGIPSSSNTPAITGLVNGSPADRFGCAHSDDSEAASGSAADLLGQALVPLLDTHGGAPETITSGRYVLPDGTLSRDPLGGPELKCNQDNVFHPNGPAVAVELPNGSVVHPSAWMSLSGLPQTTPDRDTRGYFDQSGNRVWLEVFPDVNLP